MVAPNVSAFLFQSSLLPETEPDKTGVFANCVASINKGYVHEKSIGMQKKLKRCWTNWVQSTYLLILT